MERQRCKLCFRSFINGKALGGHMRSHMMNLYTKKKSSKTKEDDFESFHTYSQSSSSSYSSSSSSSKESEKDGLLLDPESETESSKNKLVCRRSKRVRKSRISDLFDQENNEQLSSSISDTTPEEDIAHCLIMLSKDKWNREEQEEEEKKFEDDIKFCFEDSDGIKVIKGSNKVRGKYKCETCNKLFRSYQALGGHRASHKRIKEAAESKGVENSGGGSKAAVVVEEKVHECPFCHRVFSSGQALGGHKRSHFVGAGAISTIGSRVEEKSRIGESLGIDLNLPAPVDDYDDDDDEISQMGISDEDLVHPIKQL
ncbi:hypothetical protein RD792_006649 [Penstemon davidsonii]|uniref:C2H2-type domain-containing protein n=1 Tax=Penstemon davidsonii TaxID=160366 RepID=A0ABR0DC65_9LAMI|nr:hypothetical protein RD792_006649 [Penstemon davidsonii]